MSKSTSPRSDSQILHLFLQLSKRAVQSCADGAAGSRFGDKKTSHQVVVITMPGDIALASAAAFALQARST